MNRVQVAPFRVGDDGVVMPTGAMPDAACGQCGRLLNLTLNGAEPCCGRLYTVRTVTVAIEPVVMPVEDVPAVAEKPLEEKPAAA